MPKTFIGNTRVRKIYAGTTRIKKVYCGNTLVFSDSHVVTYHVNTNDIRQIEIDDGADGIAGGPTPEISGWTFVGWREDITASASVLSSKIINADGIHLYAVFNRTLTLSYNANGGAGTTASSTGTQYYNNGNTLNPSITTRATGYSRANYRFDYWNIGSTSGTAVAAGNPVTISQDTVAYAHWTQTVFVLVDGNYSWSNANLVDFPNNRMWYLSAGQQLHVYVRFISGGTSREKFYFSNYGTPYTQGTAIGGWLTPGQAAQINLAWSSFGNGKLQVSNDMVGTGYTTNETIYVKIWIQ